MKKEKKEQNKKHKKEDEKEQEIKNKEQEQENKHKEEDKMGEIQVKKKKRKKKKKKKRKRVEEECQEGEEEDKVPELSLQCSKGNSPDDPTIPPDNWINLSEFVKRHGVTRKKNKPDKIRSWKGTKKNPKVKEICQECKAGLII